MEVVSSSSSSNSHAGKSGGKMNGISEITINVPSEDTQRIQEAHIMVGQILCSLVEDDLLKD